MEYYRVIDMAKKWGMQRTWLSKYCKDGRIPGAMRIGRFWYIPADAEKPMNLREDRNPGYLSAAKTAEKWGVSKAFVCQQAKAGNISGAMFINGYWHIPESAESPAKNASSYLCTTEIAERWGVKVNRVSALCKAGRVSGAEKCNGKWYIPENVEKPVHKTVKGEPGYISAREAAEKWNASRSFVCSICREGRVPNAKRISGNWYIPEETERPKRTSKK